MHDKPDKVELLQALAEFLMVELKPATTDPRLSFRVLIAANLAQVVANELTVEPALEAAELARLRALLPDAPADAPVGQLNAELAARLRTGRVDFAAARRALLETLRDKLKVNNPFFDTRPQVD